MKKLLILIIGILSVFVTACSNYIPAYRIDVQQGNILTQKDIDQLKVGMNKRKIEYIIGSPAIRDPFHKNRWDYTYTYTKGRGETEKKNITLYFKSDLLVKTSGSMKPNPEHVVNPSEYKKQNILTVTPVVREKPGWLKLIWYSFFGSEEDLDLGID
ncbi:MAG: outer membrane protein assembly factor BamE [Gammaproteobacteria bacterium]|nr:outer membrane protein assembly factor BamE [Gammaproteobacteria bacterium]